MHADFPILHPFDIVATWDRIHGTRLVLIMDQQQGLYVGFPLKNQDPGSGDVGFGEQDWQSVFMPPETGQICFHEPVKIAPNFLTRRVARLHGPIERRLTKAYSRARA